MIKAEDKICPECGAKGGDVGGRYSTAMYCAPFVDEDGKVHHHDRNSVSTTLQCHKGHSWTAKDLNTCWCGWIQGQEIKR